MPKCDICGYEYVETYGIMLGVFDLFFMSKAVKNFDDILSEKK